MCEAIAREESPSCVARFLRHYMLSYICEGEFRHKRVLDFGCGGGASTFNMARMFPETEIVGVELDEWRIDVANKRRDHYALPNVAFRLSPGPDRLPEDLGAFDFISLSAVYEHLHPHERKLLMPKLWGLLKPGGVLFLNQTPHRYFPLEHHTTGLPLLNYLPKELALASARRLSRRVDPSESWEGLLRSGVRGGSVREVLGLLRATCDRDPRLLKPSRLGMSDRIDLWYAVSTADGRGRLRPLMRVIFKAFKRASGRTVVPSLNLAIQKG